MRDLKTLVTSFMFLCSCSCLCAQNTVPKRVVVLSPALLQTLKDVGLEDNVVCAAEPFKDTRHKIKSVGYYHRPSTEIIVSCKPDLIIVTYAGTPPDVYQKLKNMGYRIIIEKSQNIEAIKIFIKKISKEFNIKTPPILKEFDSACTKKKAKTTAVVLVGLDPMFGAGDKTFVSSALACAGIDNKISGEYLRLGIENIIAKNPEMIIIASDGPEQFKDYKELKKHFKKIVVMPPDILLEPSSKILKGIERLKSELKD